MDTRLTLQEHVKEKYQKAKKAMGALMMLCNSQGGTPPRSMKLLYCNLIRPIYTYASELWFTKGDKMHIPFKLLEYQILRKITGAYHGSRKTSLHAITGIDVDL